MVISFETYVYLFHNFIMRNVAGYEGGVYAEPRDEGPKEEDGGEG